MRQPIVKPKAMQPGQTVGLIAPSSAIAAPATLDAAVSNLEKLGYRVKVGESCLSRHGYLAGEDAVRAGDINGMFRDDTIDAILCARGGYGATRILGSLDYAAMRANPKVFSGFSDITALHSAIRENAGLITFHGLMALSDLADDPEPNDAFSLDAFWRVVSNAKPAGLLCNPAGFGRGAVVPGRAQGPLIGGNLTLVAGCLGTPYAYDFDGAILFLEEVSEPPYCVDRLLTQLSLAGVFDRVAGVLLGEFTGCHGKDASRGFSVREVFADRFGKRSIPVLDGIRCGHVATKLTLPIGVTCAMDAERGAVEILESAVV